MTQWVAVGGGRPRGPLGLVRAWARVMARPRTFFRHAVSSGDQAQGLVFAMAVAGIAAAGWALRSATGPPLPVEPPVFGYVLSWLGIVGLVTPFGLHLMAALQTVALVLVVPAERRAGVGETVQVIAYATAPCIVVGVGSPWLTLIATAYAIGLLVVGLSVRNDVSVPSAVVIGAPSAVAVFGWAYRGIPAGLEIWRQLTAAVPGLFN